MIRVAGLTDQAEGGVLLRSPDGRTPRESLHEIRERTLKLSGEQAKLWKRHLKPALAEQGVVVAEIDDLDDGAARARGRLRARDLPRAHAIGRRPSSAVPVHLWSLAQPRSLLPRR